VVLSRQAQPDHLELGRVRDREHSGHILIVHVLVVIAAVDLATGRAVGRGFDGPRLEVVAPWPIMVVPYDVRGRPDPPRAAMAAIMIVREDGEVFDQFKGMVARLFANQTHDVAMAGLHLARELLLAEPELSETWAEFAKSLAKTLKALFETRPTTR